MEDPVLNFKETLIAQLTDYLMVARIDQDDEGNDIAIGGGYYSVADLMTLLNTIEVEDNLTSVNTVTALSANQGRLLKAMIDAKVSSTLLGVADGVATLGNDGKVPTAQLPSYVDDVIEYADLASFPTTGETDKIYVALDTNKTYRWGGSAYVEISPSLAIGEVTGTAYDGAKGKANADGIATNTTNIDTTNTNVEFKVNATTETLTDNKIEVYADKGSKIDVSFDNDLLDAAITIRGVNEFDGNIIQGSLGSSFGEFAYTTKAVCSENFISIDEYAVKYCMSYSASIEGLTAWIFFYDEDKNFISYETNYDSALIPTNAKYLKFRLYNASGLTSTPSDIDWVQIQQDSITNFVDYAKKYKTTETSLELTSIADLNYIYAQDGRDITVTYNKDLNYQIIDVSKQGYSNFYGKNLYTFGDSITEMEYWQSTVVEQLGLSGYTKKSTSGGTLHLMYEQIKDTPLDSDIVTFWLGTNDYAGSYGLSLGTIDDDFSLYDTYTTDSAKVNNCTFYGCLKYCCDWLATNMYDKSINFITPLQRYNADGDIYMESLYGTNSVGQTLNALGYSLNDYADAVIEVTRLYGFRCLDLFGESGISKNNVDYTTQDGLHPTETYAIMLGRKIANFINNG